MELCKYCRDIDFQIAFPPPRESWGMDSSYTGYKHQPDLAHMIQAAQSGCELCSFFLKCAGEWPHDSLRGVQAGGQLFLRGAGRGDMYLASEVLSSDQPSGHVEKYLCRFDCFAPHSKL
jgi:hypothetical protein